MIMPFVNTKPIRLIELFAGIGSQAMALTRLGLHFEHYKMIEFDKSAVRSYNAVHHTTFAPSDITQIHGSDLGIVDTDEYTYLLTYSFPCQDLSLAGKQKGMRKGDGTRSGLLWEVERILQELDTLPQVLLMENVTQVHSKKNFHDFEKWLTFLESKGYSNYYQDLNAKDYGVAQNRNRCFMVSILGNHCFYFPKAKRLDKTVQDYLEKSVDDKYYISDEKIKMFVRESFISEKDDVPRLIGGIGRKDFGSQYRQGNRVYDSHSIAMCLTASPIGNTGGNSYLYAVYEQPSVLVKQATKQGYIECVAGGVADLSYPTSNTRRGRVQENGKISPTITASQIGIHRIESIFRIRKLTPKECWRLMGFDDEAFNKAVSTSAETQLYKQAGNSIVVDVLMAIFENLFIKARSIWLDELLSA